MCGRPVYEKVLKNIITLKEHGIDVRLNLSITPYNCEDIEAIHQISETHQIPVKASSYMYPPIRLGREVTGYGNRLSSEESARYAVRWDRLNLTEEQFKERAETMRKLVTVDKKECFDNGEDGIRCRAGSTSFWMTWDGQMRPCGMMPEPTTYPLRTGFEKAWDVLREETKKIRRPETCIGCEKKEICGQCAAVCVAETGSFDQAPDYMCQRTKEILRVTCEMADQ